MRALGAGDVAFAARCAGFLVARRAGLLVFVFAMVASPLEQAR
ncbi:hypothetical protein [Cognatilysobacter tabacisoli]|nr:hypothetical protein [Lysobacter tabacisoli]